MTLLLECTSIVCCNLSNIAINEFYIFPIILTSCLMLLVTYFYVQYYAGIIGGSLNSDMNIE